MIVVKTDASKQGNDIGIGWCIEQDGSIVESGSKYLNSNLTSVEAEFIALIEGMKKVLKHPGYQEVTFYTDCKPVVSHISNDNPINGGTYLDQIKRHGEAFKRYLVLWLSRDSNEVADAEAHAAVERNK